MSDEYRLADTLTEAQARSHVSYRALGLPGIETNVRQVPYVEIYRDSSAVRETPADRLQSVADTPDRAAASKDAKRRRRA